MGKMSIFTPEQKLIFDKVSRSEYLRRNFYFTGGTALAEYYLRHRYSDDLDFFSENEFDIRRIETEARDWVNDLGITYRYQKKGFVYFFFFGFKKSTLKVDFGHYPPKRVEKGKSDSGIAIDSLLDIAINKFASIHQRIESKDLVDLYFLLKKYTIWDLMEGARVKFNLETDPWNMGADLIFNVRRVKSLPRMIKPLDLEELTKYFQELGKKLGKRAVE